MLAMYWIPVLVHPDSVSFVPFVVGAVGYLWLLVADNVDRVRRFGRRFTGEGAMSTCGSRRRWPPPVAGWPWSACWSPSCCRWRYRG